jgi:hypothetical protein
LVGCAQRARSRKFSHKLHNFFKAVTLNGKVLGTAAHHFYKEEYQACGAPHNHILLWIEGAPMAGKDDDDQWIQERINPELHQLITKYQHHKCNDY